MDTLNLNNVKVEKLALSPSFGVLSKMDITSSDKGGRPFVGVEKIATPTYNPDGSFNRNIGTYLLNKKQAI